MLGYGRESLTHILFTGAKFGVRFQVWVRVCAFGWGFRRAQFSLILRVPHPRLSRHPKQWCFCRRPLGAVFLHCFSVGPDETLFPNVSTSTTPTFVQVGASANGTPCGVAGVRDVTTGRAVERKRGRRPGRAEGWCGGCSVH